MQAAHDEIVARENLLVADIRAAAAAIRGAGNIFRNVPAIVMHPLSRGLVASHHTRAGKSNVGTGPVNALVSPTFRPHMVSGHSAL